MKDDDNDEITGCCDADLKTIVIIPLKVMMTMTEIR